MHYPVSIKTAIPFFFISLAQYSNAQQKLSAADSVLYYSKIQFIQEAPDILSSSLEGGKWLQIRNFAENWQRSEEPSDELIFSINTLLAIQGNKFSVLQFPCDFMYLLEDYSKELNKVNEQVSTFKYKIKLTKNFWYDATGDVQKLLDVIRAWSLRLMSVRQLSSTELYLCRVFSGQIIHPRSVFNANKKDYADLNAFELGIAVNNNDFFVAQRNRKVGTVGIMAGIWIPTGNLRTLGMHPGLGVWFGVRNQKNEYDIVTSLRFLQPTPRAYTVLINDSLQTTNYYDGGYVGFDYTRYIIHKTKYDLGLISAIGYDFFDYTDGNESNANGQSTSSEIGSFDFSNGIRLKFFLRPRAHIGLAAKYHLIHYVNKGGTDLSGNAFSIDILYGSN
jgi:hypothetical protein